MLPNIQKPSYVLVSKEKIFLLTFIRMMFFLNWTEWEVNVDEMADDGGGG